MKDSLGKVSDLTRISLHDLKKSFSLLKLTALQTAINEQLSAEEGEGVPDIVIDIPMFGKIKITDDLDFNFVPDVDFKKDVYQAKQNPDLFLKRELKKILKVTDKKGD